MTTIEVHAADAARLADAAAVLSGPRGRDACWCQRFVHHDATDNRTAFEEDVATADRPVGLVAHVDGEPAGWSRVAPRETLPGIQGNRALRRLYDHDDVEPDAAWWITCFAVRRAHRGRGVGVALLRAAAGFAREHGAVVLDGHPVDVERLTARPSPSAVFTGTVSMFTAAGFVELGRTYVSRPVMRRRL